MANERTFKFNQNPIPVKQIPKLIEDLKKLHDTEMAKIIAKEQSVPPKKIKVTYEDGSTFETASLADIKEAEKMYVGKEMQTSDGRKIKATSVEEVKEEAPKQKPSLKRSVIEKVNPRKKSEFNEKVVKPIIQRLIRDKKAGTYTRQSGLNFMEKVVTIAVNECAKDLKISEKLSPTDKLEIAENLLKAFPEIEKPASKPVGQPASNPNKDEPVLFEHKSFASPLKKKIKENCLTNNEYDREKVRQALKTRMFKVADELGIEAQWYDVKGFLEADALETIQLDLENTPELKAIDKAGTKDQDITSNVVEAVDSLSSGIIEKLWGQLENDSDYWDTENGHPGN